MNRTSRMAQHTPFTASRRLLAAVTMLFTLTACKAAPMNVTLDVVTFNYLNRPIYDIFIGGKGGDSSTAYPATGGSTISGVRLKLGPQTVTWTLDGEEGTPRNGEVVHAKNSPTLSSVPDDAVFLAIHIYPDETVELIPSRHYPRETEKGHAMAVAGR